MAISGYELVEGTSPGTLKERVEGFISRAGTDWEPWGEPFSRTQNGKTVFYQAMINGSPIGSASSLAVLDGVTAGTVTASKAVVVDASKNISTFGDVSAANATITSTVTCTNVDAGASGNAGSLDIFPTTASKGKLRVTATDSTGNTTTTITNAAQAGTVTYTIPDAGAAASFVLTTGTATATTATTAELNYVDIATLGTLAASKAWTSDASLDTVMPTGGLLTVQSGGAVTMNAGSTLTLSGGVVQAPVFVADATPYTVLAADSGKIHIILEQTSSITLNLPVIAAGLSYKFVMGGVATEAQNWVIVATTPSFYNGGIVWTDLNDAESNVAVVYGNGTSHLTLTVTTPAAGTEIEIYSNGTEWFVHGAVISDSTPAFT